MHALSKLVLLTPHTLHHINSRRRSTVNKSRPLLLVLPIYLSVLHFTFARAYSHIFWEPHSITTPFDDTLLLRKFSEQNYVNRTRHIFRQFFFVFTLIRYFDYGVDQFPLTGGISVLPR